MMMTVITDYDDDDDVFDVILLSTHGGSRKIIKSKAEEASIEDISII